MKPESNNSVKREELNKNLVPLHLQLPDITSESQEHNNKPPIGLEVLDISSGAEENEEEMFCRKHLIKNRRRVPSELRELYEVLKNLPSLNYPQSRNNNRRLLNTSRERTLRWVTSTSTTAKDQRKRKENPPFNSVSYHPSSVSHCPNSDSCLSGSSDQTVADDGNGTQQEFPTSVKSFSTSTVHFQVSEDYYYEEDKVNGGFPERELVKMHSINLYQSILPSTYFSKSRVKLHK